MPSRSALLFALVAALLLPTATASAAPDIDTVHDITFPVSEWSHYVDDYHNSRGGGRLHKSTDIMAPRGTPVYAAMGGEIRWITGLDNNPPSYGYMITVRGDDGLDYDYIHLGTDDGPASEAYAPGMGRNVRVERGQLIGFVGNSGCGCVDHLHFAMEDPAYPSNDSHYDHFRYNPYRSLVAAEERGDIGGSSTSAAGAIGAADGARPLIGDWNGDGNLQPGWWHRGDWALDDGNGGVITFSYGRDHDAPIVGDWDGDGSDEIGIIRDREWHLRYEFAGGRADEVFTYGRMTRGDQPLVGDWNGDGVDEIGIVRDREWHLRWTRSDGPANLTFVYGRTTQGDVPLIGDWDGDGKDTVGIVRDGEWHLNNRLSGGSAVPFTFGRVLRGDIPVVGDWDKNGTTDVGVVRGTDWLLREKPSAGPATRTWDFTGR